MQADRPGKLLKGCSWVGVPFAGGMSEIPHFDARTVVVNDRHRHVINLAVCVAHADLKSKLVEWLEATPFHPDVLALAQQKSLLVERTDLEHPDVEAAYHYFVCAWMARNGTAGTDGEFKASLSFRYEAGGGDSAVRFRNATASLEDWHKIMRRCTFSTDDAFVFLGKCKDQECHGIYSDAPWPADGDGYKHKFGEKEQRRLAEVLTAFERTKVVVRFGDHPLIREIYREPHWMFLPLTSRTAANKAKAEVLIVNRRGVTP